MIQDALAVKVCAGRGSPVPPRRSIVGVGDPDGVADTRIFAVNVCRPTMMLPTTNTITAESRKNRHKGGDSRGGFVCCAARRRKFEPHTTDARVRHAVKNVVTALTKGVDRGRKHNVVHDSVQFVAPFGNEHRRV